MTTPGSPAPSLIASVLPPAITVGFGAAAVMWLVGYVTHLPGLQSPAWLVGCVLIAVHLIEGVVAGRAAPSRRMATGALAGLITGLVNLLVLGALLVDPDSANELTPGAPQAVVGYLAFSVLASTIGAAIARFAPRKAFDAAAPDAPWWLARFAIVTAAAAVPVLLSGGLVTSTNAGLAVVDWPTSFQANMFLFPLSRMTGGAGIYYEHAHRLFGSLIGLTTLALLVFTLVVERRAWVKALVAAAFLLVVAQGVLGGVRVTSATPMEAASVDNPGSLALAAVHGITAQLFFAYLCVTAAIFSSRWRAIETGGVVPAPERWDPMLRRFTLILLIVLFIQLVLGSVTRHFNHAHAAFTHTGFSLIVLTFAALAGFRASGRHREEPMLRRFGAASTHTVMLQMLLGAVTLFMVMPFKEGKIDPPATVIIATAHQANGALLFAFAAVLFAWTRRLSPARGGAA